MPSGIYKRIKKRGGWKLSLETRKKLSESKKGKKCPWIKGQKVGFKHSEATKEKMKIAQLGKKKPPRSEIYRKNIGLSHKGEKCHWWKGGRTSLRHQIHNSFEYKKWRSEVFQRDNWTCQTCGIRGCWLDCHHIKEFSKILDEFEIKNLKEALNCKELWNINNGVSFCRECHKLTKNGRPRLAEDLSKLKLKK